MKHTRTQHSTLGQEGQKRFNLGKILSIKEQHKVYRSADVKVLNFIDRFRSQSKDLSRIFTQGYCYYFAAMLKDAFGGDIYLSPETDHIIAILIKLHFYTRFIFRCTSEAEITFYPQPRINNLLHISSTFIIYTSTILFSIL